MDCSIKSVNEHAASDKALSCHPLSPHDDDGDDVNDTIRDDILACARKPTRVYRTETTTKKRKTEKKLKSKNGYAQK